jgi:Arc/MetJ-type ribon-helix-helix transcriptional regulator
LTEEQDRLLGELGREMRVSKAELVRRAVDLLLASEASGRGMEEQRRRALAVAGRFRSGGGDGARRHDAALAEAFAEAFAETGRRSGTREG